MIKQINDVVIKIKGKYYNWLIILFVLTLGIVETGVLCDINNSINNHFQILEFYIVFIPIGMFFVSSLLSNRMLFKLRKNVSIDNNLKYIRYSFIVTIFLYLICVLINFNISDVYYKTKIMLVCLITMFLSQYVLNYKANSFEEKKTEYKDKEKSKLFNTYYINIDKVFEIAMLINNKIAISIQKERTMEDSESLKENQNANINLEYLKVVKSGITYDDTYTKTNSEKNRVLENFDVKTTKSNLLDTIIKKCKEYEEERKLLPGDLLILNDVKIELMNQEETMQISKMLLNGAFNGTNLSSTSDEMKMDFNISSLTNSMLKDCCYELKCSTGNLNFYIKIPMSSENDFENSYNIYDLLIGKMTLIGVYIGQDEEQKYRSAFDYFNNNQTKTEEVEYQESGLKKSASSEINSVNGNGSEDKNKNEIRNYVDIIAIIQEININISEVENG